MIKKILGLYVVLFVANVCHASHFLIVPNCLLNKLTNTYRTHATTQNFTLIETNHVGLRSLIALKNKSPATCGGFINVTADVEAPAFNQNHYHDLLTINTAPVTKKNDSYQISHQKTVSAALKNLNTTILWSNLQTFTHFYDRYANSQTGVEASEWLQKEVANLAKTYHRHDLHVTTIATPGYKQPTVIAKLGESSSEGIVVGAHMDGVKSGSMPRPAADDDGSGSMTVLETLRTILASDLKFKRPIYFIWYAAEEEGLVGSGQLVKEFTNKNVPVKAVLHFDLTGYAYRNDMTMWLITDNVNAKLTDYLGELIKVYVKRPVKRTACGFACSDHASWTRGGYSAAIPAEAKFENTNPAIHSARDTMDHLSLEHMTDYAKLAIAFAIELAEPTQS